MHRQNPVPRKPSMTNQLIIIDPQNDFCDIPEFALPASARPALAVPGAHQDMLRVRGLLELVGKTFDGITVTLDSHPFVAIERTTMWQDALGADVAPFTEISLADFEAGTYRLRYPFLYSQVGGMLESLEATGRKLMVWPVHCVTGTWGHNIHAEVSCALNEWEKLTGRPVRKVLKGEYPLAEHYGVFEADVPRPEVAATQFNTLLAAELSAGVERLFVAGEASSHCVAASVRQLIKFRGGSATGIVLLTDCMSPVPGFEADAETFLREAAGAGAQLMTASQAISLLSA